MKKTILASLVVVASATLAANAMQSAFVKSRASVTTVIEEKVKIKKDELPEAIKKTLSGEDYKGWTIESAYLYKESNTYEVEVKKGEEKKTFKFDKDGKKL